MAGKKNSQNTMLAHSRAKVEFYEKYLERYLPILSLSKYISTINIYDCFVGGKTFFFKQWGTWGCDGVKRDKHKNGKQLD